MRDIEKLRLIANERLEERDYWQGTFFNGLTPTVIHYDTINNIKTIKQECFSFEIEKTISEKIIHISDSSDFKLFIVLHACLRMLMYKYSDNTEICILSPILTQENDENLINKLLPIKSYLFAHQSLKEILSEVRKTIIDAYKNQNYPFELILEDIISIKKNNIQKYIDVSLLLENIHNISYFGDVKTNLMFALNREDKSLTCKINYSPDKYSINTVKQIAMHFTVTISNLLDNSNISLRDLNLLSSTEIETILYKFNNASENKCSINKSTIDLIEEQVDKYPDKVILVANDHYITYNELNNKSNQLARKLNSMGIKSNSFVALLFERSIDMIIGIMGTLKSGCAYLPIETGLPEFRIISILNDSCADVLLTDSTLIDEYKFLNLTEYKGNVELVITDQITKSLKIVPVDLISEELSSLSKSNVNNFIKPSDFCYMMYTSGSTGTPKGTLISHDSVIKTIKDTNYLKVSSNDKILQLSNYAFDGSIFDIFSSLFEGASLCLIKKSDLLNIDELKKIIIKENISVFFLTTALFNTIVDLDKSCLKNIRKILFGGERVSMKHTKNAYHYLGKNKILHMYGPTETTVYATFHEVNEINEYELTIPIGKPVANKSIYILDKDYNIVPVSVPGELYIGGEGISDGYLNQPELTASKFIQNPFNKKEIIYKTGDIARWSEKGDIEFLGRKDNQVKIRGQRIELEEIEKQILNYKDINEAFVTVYENELAQKSICAYYIENKDRVIDIDELRETLSGCLPEYMLPTYFIGLEKFQLSPNGKIDKKLLPIPSHSKRKSKRIIPENEIEVALVKIWSEVLGIDENNISIDDDFFQLGGNSLMSTILIHKIHSIMDVKISLMDFFKNPVISNISRLIGSAKKEKFISITKSPYKPFYDLSPAQKRLFIISQLNENNTNYVISFYLELNGLLDNKKLENAFQELINRHEVLRTSFKIIDGQPVQEIHPSIPFQVKYISINKNEVNEYLEKNCVHFDLEKAPLIRATVLQINNSENLLAIDLHHIIADGISLEVLSKEFKFLYAGKILENLPLQYKDFSEWQNSSERKLEIKKQEKYWIQKFEGDLPILNLPIDTKRETLNSFKGNSKKFFIDNETTAILRKISEDQCVTMYMLLFSIFNILLSKLSGQEDIIVGTPISGRRHANLENVIGMFVNTLAIRSFPNKEMSFLTYIQEFKKNIITAFDNQDYPFEELINKVKIERDLSRNPLFSVLFSFQNITSHHINIKEENIDLIIKPFEFEKNVSKFDITLAGQEVGDKIVCNLQYSTSILTGETIDRFIKYFKIIIHSVCHNQDQKLIDIDYIPFEEKQKLLYEFNNTEKKLPNVNNIYQLFEVQSLKTPDKIAVVFGKQKISYTELSSKSDELALILQEKGIKCNDLVGILVDSSLEMVISIIAVLKSGAAFIPIDPNNPTERISLIIQDSHLKFLLTQEQYRYFTNELGYEKIILSTALYKRQNKLFKEVGNELSSNNPGYVIYTSGSTGKPKGVKISHKNLINYFTWFTDKIEAQIDDKYLLTTSFAFDFFYTKFFGSLLSGGELHVIPKETYFSPYKLLNYIKANKITVLKMTPTLFNSVLNYTSFDLKVFRNVRLLIFGGEPINTKDVELVKQMYPSLKVMNHYGPTETTIGTISQFITNDNLVSFTNKPTIGRPIQNAECYILDEKNNLKPIGCEGELCIGGAGVGLGYLNNEELTSEKFVPNPFKPGLIYRTGDLARWLSNGNIEFLGRKDFQVKVRGYRIELEEIEKQLLKYPNIREVVVIAKKDKGRAIYLIAYYVGDEKITSDQLREYLFGYLPDYMIPACFIKLSQMPLTANGKIDLNKLPDIIDTVKDEMKLPINETEGIMLEIWSELLEINKEEISTSANFFTLGGHSLKATLLISLIYKRLKVKLNLKDVFLHPTINRISNYIKTLSSKKYISIPKAESKNYYELTPAQKRVYFLQQVEKGILYNVPKIITIEGELNIAKLNSAFQNLILRHEILRTSFPLIDGIPYQLINDPIEFKLDLIDLESCNQINVDEKIKKFIKPFNLSTYPLLRAGIFKVNANRNILVIDMHHIISDAYSNTIFTNELAALYKNETLPKQNFQFKDYSEWKVNQPKINIQKQKEYWLNKFKTNFTLLNLPLDFKRPNQSSFKGNNILFDVDSDKGLVLKQIADNEEVTFFMMLLSIYNILLSKLCNQENITVGTAVSGREHPDTHGILGIFINIVAIKNSCKNELSFRNYLKQVKENVIEAFDNQDFQFEDLIHSLEITNKLNRNPLFDAGFMFQNVDRHGVNIKDLGLGHQTIQYSQSRFDLYLNSQEVEGKIMFSLEYSTDLFKEETISRFINYFKIIIDTIIENPDILLKDIILIKTEDINIDTVISDIDFAF